MAKRLTYKSRYADRIKNIQKASSDINQMLSPVQTTNNMSNSINNYQNRITAVGVNPEDVTDTRNPIEKLLNLPEDQNVLFDIFDIIGRPQQALFRGIESAQEGGSFLEGMKEGFSGEETTNFGDILRNAGMDDKKLFTNPISGDDTSLSDILGLVGDIVLDPVDLALVAATPVTAGASDAALAAKEGAKAAKIADDVSDIAKAAKIADDATDATKYVYKFNPLKAMFSKDSKSALDLAMGGVGKGIKKSLGLGDNLLTKGLDKIDTKGYYNAIRNEAFSKGLADAGTLKKMTKSELDNVAETLVKKGVNLEQYTNNLGDAYKGIKQGIKRTADYGKSLPGNIYNKINRTDNAIDTVSSQANLLVKNSDDKATRYAESVGRNIDDVMTDINNIISSEYKTTTTGKDALKEVMDKGKSTITGTKKEINNFREGFQKLNRDGIMVDDIINFKLSNDGKTLKITTKNKKALNNILNNNANSDILDAIKKTNSVSINHNDRVALNKLIKEHANDKEFQELLEESRNSYSAVAEMLSETTGNKISYADIANRKGFTKNLLTDEGRTIEKQAKARGLSVLDGNSNANIGSKAVTSGKQYSNFAPQAEKEIQQTFANKSAQAQKHLDNLKKHQEVIADKVKKVEELTNKKEEIYKVAKENLDKIGADIKDVKTSSAQIKSQLDDLNNVIKDTMKKSSYIVDENLPNDLIKQANKYTDSLNKQQDLIIKLSNESLSKEEVTKIWHDYEKAQNKVIKNQEKLYLEKARIDGAIQKKELKNINKAVDMSIEGSSSLTKKVFKNQEQFNDLTKKLKSVQEGVNKTAINLDKKINNINIEIDKLKNMTPSEIENFNKNVISQAEKLQRDIDFYKSAEVVKFYETSFTKGLGDFINMTTKDAKDLNRYNEILLHGGLNDESIIRFVPKGENVGKIQTGYTRLSSEEANTMLNFLENKKNFLPESQELIKDLKSKIKNSSAIVIDKDLKSMLKLNFNEKNVSPFVKMIDGFNNTFKKYKVMTPGFHLRNISGNATNMVMSGVPISDIPGLYKKANKLANKDYVVKLFSKKAAGELTEAELKDFNTISKFMQGGFFGKGKEIQDLGEVFTKASTDINKSKISELVDKVFTANMNANEWVDNRNRMALFLHAEKNPKYLSKLGAKDSIDAVKKVLFDPDNLSPFEKNTLKRVIPFYTFTKQNLMFHADNIMKNTSKYNRLIKTFNETYDALPEESYRTYQKENMQIPVGMDADGNVATLKTNLPVSDLGEYLSNPLQRLVSSTSPLIKAPFEKVTGKDTFTGQDLYKSTPDQLASWLGIDSITTGQLNKIDKIGEDIDNDVTLSKYISDILPSIMHYNDSEKIANANQYEELMQYQGYVKQLKNQGIDVPTIRELKSNTNSSIKAIEKARKRYEKSR